MRGFEGSKAAPVAAPGVEPGAAAATASGGTNREDNLNIFN
jgi:hypothetical protein